MKCKLSGRGKRTFLVLQGRLKGRLLSKADLPEDLAEEIAKHLEWSVPSGKISILKKITMPFAQNVLISTTLSL